LEEKEYIIPYSENARKRHYHETAAGKVVKFMVQLETNYDGKWCEVVRYDCTHGFAHRDSFNLSGNSKKEELSLAFEEALTLADDDLDENLDSYIQRFLEGAMP